MSFLNEKEQVLDIELTQYGKLLLAEGSFEPVYYEFFDDDVLYDGEYASLTEVQNDIEPRISSSVRLGSQYMFETADSTLLVETTADKVVSTTEIDKALKYPMGKAELGSPQAPAWKLNFMGKKCEITSIETTSTNAGAVVNIPQVNVEVEYLIQEGRAPDEFSSEFNFSEDFVMSINPEMFLLELQEENGMYTNRNFSVEVFEILTAVAGSDIQELVPMFHDEQDERGVDTLFEIDRDHEIDPDIKALLEDEGRSMFIQSALRGDDESEEEVSFRDIYNVGAEDFEDCD